MSAAHVQTKREISQTLAEAGISPRKRLGQNFLIDGNLMRKLVEAADIRPDDTILEVGGGTGGLTDLLVDSGAAVICVEIDPPLQDHLAGRFAGAPNFTLLRGDVLESKHHLRTDLAAMLTAAEAEGCVVKLVANLPYQAATPLIMNLIVDYPAVRRFCFTVQKEVGERIGSPPSRKSYGPLSIICQLVAEGHVLAKLPPSVFWPAPTVASLMLRMDVRERPFADRDELRRFVAFVRGVFEHRRKTLRSALRYVEQTVPLLPPPEFEMLRPEELPPSQWVELFALLKNGLSPTPRG